MSRTVRALRRATVALAALLLSVVVLSGVARAGTRFFHCRVMDTITAAPCCSHAADHEGKGSEGPALGSPALACCEPGLLPAMPTASAAHAPEQLQAPLVPMVSLADPLDRMVVASTHRPPGYRHARTAPKAASAAELCARLSVFLV
jgi:hypothetical protein